MKKKLFFIVALIAALSASKTLSAQEFKPEEGDVNIEINFTPFTEDNPIEINSLRFRYFTRSDFALRIGIHVFSNRVDDPDGVTADAINISNIVGFPVNSYELEEFEFGFNLGFEKHWAGTERLSPYWGFDFSYLTYNFTETVVFDDGFGRTFNGQVESGENSFGLNLVFGADYYFARKFYFGTEVGFGFVTTNSKDIESVIDTTPNTTEGPSNTRIGESVNGSIRIGYLF